MMESIIWPPQSGSLGGMKRKAAATEVILDELEMLSRMHFVQGHISRAWFDQVQEFLLEQRALLDKPIELSVAARFNVESGFALAGLVYGLLLNEASGTGKYIRAGFRSLEGAGRSHAGRHEAVARKAERQKTIRNEFMAIRKKTDSTGKPPSKNACYMRLAGKHGCSRTTIKRDCRGL